jgi:hypothetical protein
VSTDQPRIAALASALGDLAGFLRDRGERWADGIDQIAAEVTAGNRDCARRFLQLHGGMGSLSDLVFHPANGNARPGEDLEELNEHFQALDRRAQDLALALLAERRLG